MVKRNLEKISISKSKKFIVSACLIGKRCFYDGSSKYNPKVRELVDNGVAIALCPEELGGLKTPRSPVEILAGSGEDVLKGKAFIFNKAGKDVTIDIVKGSKEFLTIALECGVRKAILKVKSPCCGRGEIYDGTFTDSLRKGNGIATALLLKNNIEVITDNEFSQDRTLTSKKSDRSKTVKNKRYGKREKNKGR